MQEAVVPGICGKDMTYQEELSDRKRTSKTS